MEKRAKEECIDNRITVEGVKYKSITNAARVYGLNSNTVSARLNKGWTIEEAFEIVERGRGRELSFLID